MPFLLSLIALSVLVGAVSLFVWWWCFMGIIASKGQVSDSMWKTMPRAGWVFAGSVGVAISSVVVMALFFRD